MKTSAGADWEYRWRFPILIISQPVFAFLTHLSMDLDGAWYAPRFEFKTACIATTLALIGLGLRVWGTTVLSETTMASLEVSTNHLARRGPYAITRNPLYLGNVLQLTGYGLFFGVIPGLLFGLFHWSRYDRIVRLEEERLVVNRGPEYVSYLHSVPRWLGRPYGKPDLSGPWMSPDSLIANGLFVSIAVGCVVATLTADLVWMIPCEIIGTAAMGAYFLLGRRSQTAVAIAVKRNREQVR